MWFSGLGFGDVRRVVFFGGEGGGRGVEGGGWSGRERGSVRTRQGHWLKMIIW